MFSDIFSHIIPIAHATVVPLEVGIGTTSSIASDWPLLNYIGAVYTFVISAIGIVAAAMIMFNGLRWASAAGNSEQISSAKAGITSAVVGLILALGSYVILNTLNPAFVNLQNLDMQQLTFPASETADGDGSGYGTGDSGTSDFSTCTKSSLACLKSTYEWLKTDTIADITSSMGGHLRTLTVYDGTGNTITLRVHEDVEADMTAVFAEIEASNTSRTDKYPIRASDTAAYAGARANVNNPSCPSMHSFGLSIDVNWTTNPNCPKSSACYSDASKHDIPDWVVSIFKSHNFNWGGDWSSVHDYMHFDWNGGARCGS
ncbi:MAG: M15 family metallopeptidase [Candidatus Kerfeldbacteria bacterium]|nr:M15 family metallopeptidase [Candidatus Kerfeldbacteria bacterium]